MERKLLEAIKNITDLNMTEDEALKLLENNNTNLMTEFGLDSLLRVQFIIELEEVFDIEVEISAGVGRRIKGSCGLLFGARAMALPGVMLTILFTILIGRINDLLLKQIKFIAVGIYVFIGMHLTSYISETIKSISNNESKKNVYYLL